MRVKLDENLPAELLADLRAAGHDADHVADQGLTGAADPVVLARARRDDRVLLTLDKGLGDVRAHRGERFPGVVLFRPGRVGRGAALAFVRRHLGLIAERDLRGRVMVVTEQNVRLR